MLCNWKLSSIITSILNIYPIIVLNIYILVILHLSKGNFSSVYSHFVPLSSAPSLLKFHRKFANLISKITCKLGMGRRNCKHGINVLLGTLFIAKLSYNNNDARITQSEFWLYSETEKLLHNQELFYYSHQILICVSQGHQVLLASRIYYGLKYRVCQIMLLFTLSRYFHSV